MRSPLSVVLPPLALLAAAWGASCGGTITERPTLDIKPAGEDTATDTPDETVDSAGGGGGDSDTEETVDTDLPPVVYTCADPTGPSFDQACTFSVNNAVAIIPTAAGAAITLRTNQSGPNPPGGFNSPAVGNRAIVGFSDQDHVPVADLTSFVIEAEKVSGSPAVGLELSLIVDLSCRVGPYKVITASAANLGTPVTLPNGHLQYTVEATQPRWAAFDGLLADDGTTVLLPDPDYTDGQPFGPLSNVVGAYPDACVRNLNSRDDYLPANASTSGVMITLGRATNLIKNEWRLWRFQSSGIDHAPL
jgi:hypothetical protein